MDDGAGTGSGARLKMSEDVELISPDYLATLIATHAVDRKWGTNGHTWASEIVPWANYVKARTILDYGCGKGTLKKAVTIPVIEYDPGIPGKDKAPDPQDLLVATDVLEHIEPDKITATLSYMRTLALNGAFFVIALKPAKLVLTDGRPAHLSLFNPVWWCEKLIQSEFRIFKHELRDDRGELVVWTR